MGTENAFIMDFPEVDLPHVTIKCRDVTVQLNEHFKKHAVIYERNYKEF